MALVTGVSGSIIKIWDMFYEHVKKMPIFDEINKTRIQALNDLSTKVEATPMDTTTAIKTLAEIENDWSRGYRNILKDKLNIESEGWGAIKGTWQRFRAIGNYTRPQIVFGATLTTVAAVGSYMLLSQKAQSRRDVQSMQDRIEEDRKRQTQTQQR